MARKEVPTSEKLLTEGIGLNQFTVDKLERLGIKWDMKRSAAGRHILLLGLAFYEFFESQNIELMPQLSKKNENQQTDLANDVATMFDELPKRDQASVYALIQSLHNKTPLDVTQQILDPTKDPVAPDVVMLPASKDK